MYYVYELQVPKGLESNLYMIMQDVAVAIVGGLISLHFICSLMLL
jgi:hypothetical protein